MQCLYHSAHSLEEVVDCAAYLVLLWLKQMAHESLFKISSSWPLKMAVYESSCLQFLCVCTGTQVNHFSWAKIANEVISGSSLYITPLKLKSTVVYNLDEAPGSIPLPFPPSSGWLGYVTWLVLWIHSFYKGAEMPVHFSALFVLSQPVDLPSIKCFLLTASVLTCLHVGLQSNWIGRWPGFWTAVFWRFLCGHFCCRVLQEMQGSEVLALL